MIEVTCTWGDGPDVLVDIKEPILLMKDVINKHRFTHGECARSQLDLSVDEAEALAHQLLVAVQQVRNLETGLANL